MTRLVAKLTLATFAFVTSLLLLYVAASVEPLWAFVAAGLGTWVTGGAFAVLIWSAVRQYVGPHPSLITFQQKQLTPERAAEIRAKFATIAQDRRDGTR